MLHSIKNLDHCRILATDAEVGRIADTYFDDARWVVRYLIVEGDHVLISPERIRSVNWPSGRGRGHARDEIRDSPTYDPDRPSPKAPSTSRHPSS